MPTRNDGERLLGCWGLGSPAKSESRAAALPPEPVPLGGCPPCDRSWQLRWPSTAGVRVWGSGGLGPWWLPHSRCGWEESTVHPWEGALGRSRAQYPSPLLASHCPELSGHAQLQGGLGSALWLSVRAGQNPSSASCSVSSFGQITHPSAPPFLHLLKYGY